VIILRASKISKTKFVMMIIEPYYKLIGWKQ